MGGEGGRRGWEVRMGGEGVLSSTVQPFKKCKLSGGYCMWTECLGLAEETWRPGNETTAY